MTIPFIKKAINKSSNLKDNISVFWFMAVVVFFIGLLFLIVLGY